MKCRLCGTDDRAFGCYERCAVDGPFHEWEDQMSSLLKEKKYYVRYKVRGFQGNQTVGGPTSDFQNGPYSYAEAVVEERDIAGYEGVYDCRIEVEA